MPYITTMTSQSSDALSQHDSERFETPNLPVLKRTPSSPSVSVITTASIRFSKVWDHTPVGRCDIIRNHQGKPIWRCRYCLKEYLESGGTKIITSHLKEYDIDVSSAQESRTTSIQSNIADAFHKAKETNYKRRCLSTIATQALDPAIVEQLYVRWITTCGVSFRMATLSEFRALLYYLNPEIDNWLPNSIPTYMNGMLICITAHCKLWDIFFYCSHHLSSRFSGLLSSLEIYYALSFSNMPLRLSVCPKNHLKFCPVTSFFKIRVEKL